MTTSLPTPLELINLSAESLPAPMDELKVILKPAQDPPSLGSPSSTVGECQLLNCETEVTLQVSLGKVEKIRSDTYRQAGGELASWLIKNKPVSVGLVASLFNDLPEDGFAPFLEGLVLGGFRFNRRKKIDDSLQPVHIKIRASQDSLAEVNAAISRVRILCQAVNLARDWGHEPANVINPITLSEWASIIAQEIGVNCTILDDTYLTELGAGAITSVGKGSNAPSRMIILEYPGTPENREEKPVVLVGKAITFDTGGYSLKDTANIQSMKYDKCGGITVIATLYAAAKLGYSKPLVGIICAAENMISGGAYHPDDILTSLSGKTIEIISTDAEGRLVLADGLTYAQQKFNPQALIDLATLTGGVVTALGKVRAGLFSNDDTLAQALYTAGETTHERLWRLPMDEEYFENIKGDDADIKNSGGREAHPIMGAIFLQQFIEEGIPWAHLDIAGVATTSKAMSYTPKGATGFGVRLLMNYLENLK